MLCRCNRCPVHEWREAAAGEHVHGKGVGFHLGRKGLPGVSPARLPLRCSGLAEPRVEGTQKPRVGACAGRRAAGRGVVSCQGSAALLWPQLPRTSPSAWPSLGDSIT